MPPRSPPPPPPPYFGETNVDKPVESNVSESKKKTPPRRRPRDATVYHAKPKGGSTMNKRLRRSRKNKSRRRHQ